VARRTTALERNEHGTVAAYRAGCRCGRCRAARSRYARRRWAVDAVRRTGSCRWKVDAAPTLAHLERLRAAGWTLRAVAGEADVPYPTLISIRQGYRRGTSRCWNTVADAVAALEPDDGRS
jgi:hypothetical protein